MALMTVSQAKQWLQPWRPSASDPWDHRKVAHLLRRAGFGGSPEDKEACRRRGVAGTISWLFSGGTDDAKFTALLGRVGGELVDLSRPRDLRAWWMFRMLHTGRPLVEKMTLFWHGHFATSVAKVGRAELMFRQNETLRRHALGNFRSLLLDVSRDPAMLIWLDNRFNRKGKPNENYARELLELFTLGIGQYTEEDVKSAARAFTGWHLQRGQFVFRPRAHDWSDKVFLGQRGDFDGEDIVDQILARPATARLLTRKLLAFFLYPDPEPALVEVLAARLRRAGYNIRAVLAPLFRSKLFYSPHAYKRLVKSPVELVVGAVQALGGRISAQLLADGAGQMGQRLFQPPTVKGWDGGAGWINPTRLIARWNFAMRLCSARGGRYASHLKPGWTARHHGLRSAKDIVDHYLDTLVQADLSAEVRKRLLTYLEAWDGGRRKRFVVNRQTLNTKVRGLIHLILGSPEYQLN